MRTPMLDRAPPRPTSPVKVRRHHRSTIIVATGALMLLAVTAGAAVALVNRPSPATPTRAAVAAIQDGLSPADPEWMFLYIRNQNPRLRTLPIARDASIKLLGTCEGPT